MANSWYIPKGCLKKIVGRTHRPSTSPNGLSGKVYTFELQCGHSVERRSSALRKGKSAHCPTCIRQPVPIRTQRFVMPSPLNLDCNYVDPVVDTFGLT